MRPATRFLIHHSRLRVTPSTILARANVESLLSDCAMQIWVDADACPIEIKTLLYRAAERRKVKVTLVANQPIRIPSSEFIGFVLVPGGMNVADRRIVELLSAGDLVITADIPLAADVCAKV